MSSSTRSQTVADNFSVLASLQGSRNAPQYDECLPHNETAIAHSGHHPAPSMSTDRDLIQARSTPPMSGILSHGAHLENFQSIDQHYRVVDTSARRILPGPSVIVDPSSHIDVASHSRHPLAHWSPVGDWHLQRRIQTRFLGEFYCVTSSYDGRFIAYGHTFSGGIVQVHDLDSENVEALEFNTHKSSVTAVTFSPDGRYIISGHTDGTIIIFDFQARNEVSKVKIHEGWIWAMAFSPDGNYVVSADIEWNVLIWDFQARTIKCVLDKPKHTISFLDFSADGMFVIGHSSQHGIDIWSAQTGKLVPLSLIDGFAFDCAWTSRDKLQSYHNGKYRCWRPCRSVWPAHIRALSKNRRHIVVEWDRDLFFYSQDPPPAESSYLSLSLGLVTQTLSVFVSHRHHSDTLIVLKCFYHQDI